MKNLLKKVHNLPRRALILIVVLAVASLGTVAVLRSHADAPYVPLYRLYKASNGDHFYTTDASERDNAVTNFGYQYERVAAYVSSTQSSGFVPLYRLYSPSTGDHFYTTDTNELNNAVSKDGYDYERIAGYVAISNTNGFVPLYRLYKASNSDHFYTIDANERDNAVVNFGYDYEWIAAYVATSATQGQPTNQPPTVNNPQPNHPTNKQSKPAAVSGVHAKASSDKVVVTWRANPGSDKVKKYYIYRLDHGTKKPLSIHTDTKYTNSGGITDGQKYCYRVAAVNAAGVGKMSATVCATPQLPRASTPVTQAKAEALFHRCFAGYGIVETPENENEAGRSIWSINSRKQGTLDITEVWIDANSGRFSRVAVEPGGHEAGAYVLWDVNGQGSPRQSNFPGSC